MLNVTIELMWSFGYSDHSVTLIIRLMWSFEPSLVNQVSNVKSLVSKHSLSTLCWYLFVSTSCYRCYQYQSVSLCSQLSTTDHYNLMWSLKYNDIQFRKYFLKPATFSRFTLVANNLVSITSTSEHSLLWMELIWCLCCISCSLLGT